MKSTVVGVVFVLLFNLTQSTQIVTLGQILQTTDPVVVMLLTFSIAAVVFLTLQLPHVSALFSCLKRSPSNVIGLNVSTVLAWLSILFALKYIEPAAADAIGFAIGPVITAVFWKQLRPEKPVVRKELMASVGIIVGVIVLTLVSWHGISAMGEIPLRHLFVGFLGSVLCGIGVVGNTIFSKRLSEKGFTTGQLLAVRFFLLILVGFAFWPAKVSLSHFSSSFYEKIGLISLFGVVLPLYILQLGIERCEPITISLILSLLPAFSYVAQFFDNRLQNSPWSLVGIVICIYFTVMGVKARFQVGGA